eukprot:6183814-Pleurochrysis_carterae.AAC.1
MPVRMQNGCPSSTPAASHCGLPPGQQRAEAAAAGPRAAWFVPQADATAPAFKRVAASTVGMELRHYPGGEAGERK